MLKKVFLQTLYTYACLVLMLCMVHVSFGQPLSPEARLAMDKGIIAAKIPDYPLAISYFEEARKIAPRSAEIFFNLGLAESKIPGRELRAICWFGAYLAANPEAANASAVKEQMVKLEVINKSNVSRFLMSTQDAAKELSKTDKSEGSENIVIIWSDYGDIAMAQKACNLISQNNIYDKDASLTKIAYYQTKDGDFDGARKTLDNCATAYFKVVGLIETLIYQKIAGDLIGAKQSLSDALKTVDLVEYYPEHIFSGGNEGIKVTNLLSIAKQQTDLSDIEGAKKTLVKALENAALIKDIKDRAGLYCSIARAQAKNEDIKAAMETIKKAFEIVELIPGSSERNEVYEDITDAQAKVGDIAGAQKTAELIKSTYYKSIAYYHIADAQAESGDIAGAQKTADLIEDTSHQYMAYEDITDAQAKVGDIAGAQKTADLIREKSKKSSTYFYIASAMVKSGDIAGAQKMVELIQSTYYKSSIYWEIAVAQSKIGDIAGAQKTTDLINEPEKKSKTYIDIAKVLAKAGDITGAQNALINAQFAADLIEDKYWVTWIGKYIAIAQKTIGAAEDSIHFIKNESGKIKTNSTLLKVQTKAEANFALLSILLKKLDNKLETDDCALNTEVFLDLDSYLKSLAKTDNSQKVYDGLKKSAEKMVKARNIVIQLMKIQMGK